MTPALTAMALGATFTAVAAAWLVRRRLRPALRRHRRATLEELPVSTLVGPILHQLAQDGWRIDAARSAHAEGFEHVLKRDRQIGLLGLRRGKQADIEPHHVDQLIGTAKTWEADRIWLVCTGTVTRGTDSGVEASLLTLVGIDELWGMHAALLSAGARSPADRAKNHLQAATLGAFIGVILLFGALVWATQSWWDADSSSTQDIAVFETPPGSTSSPSAVAVASDPLLNQSSTTDQQVSEPVPSATEPAPADPAPFTSSAVADPSSDASAGSDPAEAAPNQQARQHLAHEVTALPAVRRASWASVSTLVINLHPGHRVEEVADRTCAMAAESPELGALRLQLLQPPQGDEPPTPRWRLCR